LDQTRSNPSAPYVGLRSFREGDSPFFFGREREVRVIASNLVNQPLTVLYGPSGVGKSSVLQAGVVAQLRAEPNTLVLYFNSWQNDTFLDELITRCRDLMPRSRTANSGEPFETLDETLAAFSRRLLLVLDQFEEYLLYQPSQGTGEQFERALARIVNQETVLSNVLIGIRDDALARLDQRFALRIANLLGNILPFGYLTVEAAKRSIEKPLEIWNNQRNGSSPPVTIEPALVDEILYQVRTGKVTASESSGTGTTAAASTQDEIETAFLQLVLKRLWEEEGKKQSPVLRLKTLNSIGGANQIVQKHVNDVMSHFKRDSDRDICAGMFRDLVTPSRTKIAQKIEDLVAFAQAAEADVRTVLNSLTDQPNTRILRRLASPERYEVYHDVLTQPILDWRQSHLQKKETQAEERRLRAEAEQKQRELEQAQALAASETRGRQLEMEAHQKTQALVESERKRSKESDRAARRLRILAAALALVSTIAVVTAIVALSARGKLERSRLEVEETLRTVNLVQARQKEAEATKAQLAGESARAKELLSEAEHNRSIAAESSFSLQQQVASIVAQLQQAQSARDQASDKLKQDEQEIARLNQLVQQLKEQQKQRPKEQPEISKPMVTPVMPSTQSNNRSIIVPTFTTSQLFRDTRIVYSYEGQDMGKWAQYKSDRWPESPDITLQNAIIRTLRSSELFGSVTASPSESGENLVLFGKLYYFGEVDGDAIVARLSYEVLMYDFKTGRKVWTQTYSHDEPALKKSVSAVVTAMGKNVQRSVQELQAGLEEFFRAVPSQP